MNEKLIKREYFQDRPVLALLITVVVAGLINLLNVLISIRSYDFKINIRFSQYGADSWIRGDWFSLYEFAVFAVAATLIAVTLSMKLHQQNRRLSILVLLFDLVIMLFLFLVSNAILNAT